MVSENTQFMFTYTYSISKKPGTIIIKFISWKTTEDV